MHRRKAIRDAIVAALAASPEILALVPTPTVESSRALTMDPAKLPRILVYLRGETVDGFLTTSPREYRVNADLVVEYVARVRATEGPSEDELDAVAEALEVTLDRLETSNLGDLVREFDYAGTEVAVSERGELLVASLLMRYRLELGRVVAPVILDDFETAAIEHKVAPATADNSSDVLTFPTV